MPIKITSRLVGQHAGGLGHQGTGDGNTLALATGKFAWAVRHAMRESDFPKNGSGVCQCLGALHAADQQRHRYVFCGGKLRQQVMKLVHKSQRGVTQFAAFVFRDCKGVAPHQRNLATTGFIESTQ